MIVGLRDPEARPVESFEDAGFDVSAARLRVRFVPLSSRRGGHDHRHGLADWLDYYERDKVLFRFTRPRPGDAGQELWGR